jgi:UDP-N-acetylmuramyl pentapeptide synthase
MTFGLDHAADVTARCQVRVDGTAMTLSTPAGNAEIALAVPGLHMARNALAATAAALGAGVTLEAVVAGLAAFRAVPGRLKAVRASAGALVLDDSYNANPDSMRAAIDVLAAAPGVRWLVMGDMGEVGAAGPEFHREIGAYAQARGIGRLYGTGELARDAVAAFGANGVHVDSVDALATLVARDAQGALTVLVKGSRFMRMERVVAALTGQPRQGAH